MSSVPQFSDTIKAYRTITPVVTKEYVRSLGDKFGFAGDLVPHLSDYGDLFGAMCPNQSYTLTAPGDKGQALKSKELCVFFTSGAIFYVDDDYFNVQPTSLPDSTTARQIADGFLHNNGFMPADAVLSDASVGQASLLSTQAMIVTYNRLINGLPVVSSSNYCDTSGNLLEVDLGNNGQVVGFYKVWRDIQPYQDVSIKTPQQAYNDLQNGKDRISETYMYQTMGESAVSSGQNGYGSVNIKEIDLGYWMQPAYEQQDYVLPVYIFKGDISGNDFNGKYTTIPYIAYVYATPGGQMP